MRETLGFFKSFISADFHGKTYLLVFLILSLFIIFNYSLDFEDSVLDVNTSAWIGWLKYFGFYSLFIVLIFIAIKNDPDVLQALNTPLLYVIILLFLSLLFLEKNIQLYSLDDLSENYYFNQKIGNQLNSLIFFGLEILLLGGILGRFKAHGFGLWKFHPKLKIYLILFLMMLPLIYLASTQANFLNSYPKLKVRYFEQAEYLAYFLKYEPLYLLNFIRIEWLFRGFFVLALYPILGRKTILLMASIYCIFHFGKPLGECISSFFGGYLLGMITYQTKSIWGGVIIHMGIAFAMDLFSLMHYL